MSALVFLAVLLAVLAIRGASPVAGGVVDGTLVACPDRPNCVCSETASAEDRAAIEPLRIPDGVEVEAAFAAARSIARQLGTIVEDSGDYVHAVFTTSILRFRDDVELRLGREERLIHIRSASRIGHSDLGANRARVERIRTRLAAELGRAPL